MDLILAVFIDCKKIPAKVIDDHIKVILKRLPRKEGVEYFVLPSNHNDVKAIPVKCFLEGVVPVENNELVGDLKEFLKSYKDDQKRKLNV